MRKMSRLETAKGTFLLVSLSSLVLSERSMRTEAMDFGTLPNSVLTRVDGSLLN